MRLALMWAMSSNRVIGRDNDLPWHLPEDLKYFKRVTMGKPIIMGRKTYDSIGRALPGRTNIVISRDPGFSAPGITCAGSLNEAIIAAERALESEAVLEADRETVIIGGAQIFLMALPKADRLYITEVHAELAGDVFFPEMDMTAWRETERENYEADEKNPYDYSFVLFEKA